MCIYRTKDGICKKYSDGNVLSYYVDGPCDQKVISNADKIRSMTDEELADFIQRVQFGDFSNLDYGKTFCDMCDGQYECDDCLKYWLKQPAEGE